ncbi:hypothetical protein C8R45DRAFT_927734 [Mycena sanguinolenta]|nr:hypothetical protein C8R45DRAFT_927734 [Mycena sanguinolenta]
MMKLSTPRRKNRRLGGLRDADLRQVMEDLRQLMRHIRQAGQQVRQIKNKRRKDSQKSPLVQATMQVRRDAEKARQNDTQAQSRNAMPSFPAFIPGRVTVHSVGYFTGFSLSPPSPRSHRSTRTTGAAALGCPHFQHRCPRGRILVTFLAHILKQCSRFPSVPPSDDDGWSSRSPVVSVEIKSWDPNQNTEYSLNNSSNNSASALGSHTDPADEAPDIEAQLSWEWRPSDLKW